MGVSVYLVAVGTRVDEILLKSVAHPVAKAPKGLGGLLSYKSHSVAIAKNKMDSQGAMSRTRLHVKGEKRVRLVNTLFLVVCLSASSVGRKEGPKSEAAV